MCLALSSDRHLFHRSPNITRLQLRFISINFRYHNAPHQTHIVMENSIIHPIPLNFAFSFGRLSITRWQKPRKRNYGLSEIESVNVSSAHLCLENQLCLNAIHSRNDTFQSQAIKLTYQSVIIDTLSQCHLHNDLAMYWCFWHVSISKQSRLHNWHFIAMQFKLRTRCALSLWHVSITAA